MAMKPPSWVRYVPTSGLEGPPLPEPADGGRQGMPSWSESARAGPMAQRPTLRSETSTVRASPVRSRWNSAPMMPPAIVMPPMESPYPGAGCTTKFSASGGVHPMALPARHQ